MHMGYYVRRLDTWHTLTLIVDTLKNYMLEIALDIISALLGNITSLKIATPEEDATGILGPNVLTLSGLEGLLIAPSNV